MLTLNAGRTRSLAPLVLLAALSVSACSQGDPPAPAGVPTATPYAALPAPTIVTPTGRVAATTTPRATSTATAATASGAERTYTVVAGDAISLIAQRFGTTAAAIRAANNLPNDDIRIGQVLKIPGAVPGTPTPGPTVGPPRPTPPPVTGDSYVVKPGDTAFGIALEFQVTLAELEQVNGVPPGGLDNIKAGQTIRVPRPR